MQLYIIIVIFSAACGAIYALFLYIMVVCGCVIGPGSQFPTDDQNIYAPPSALLFFSVMCLKHTPDSFAELNSCLQNNYSSDHTETV